ncbi:MAG: hypothetical protein DPW16_08295 [Chloroflexi bacterium]|nr:hypothetical protein [Chloroflexota bacterium]
MGRFPLLNFYRYLLYLSVILLVVGGFFVAYNYSKEETELWDNQHGYYTETSHDTSDFLQAYAAIIFFAIPLVVVAELIKLNLFVEDHLYHIRYQGVIINSGAAAEYIPDVPPVQPPKLPAAISNLIRKEALQKAVARPSAKNIQAHDEAINAVAMFPDGKRLVSASNDKTLKIWNIDNFECLATLKGHGALVKDVVISHDGQHIISCSMDKTLKIWSAESELQTLTGHSDSVNALSLAPNSHVVSASSDRTLKIWDMTTGDVLHTLEGHEDAVNAVTVSPDGRKVVSASRDLTIKVWDLQSGAEIHTLKGHTAKINTVTVLADGKLFSTSDDGTFRFWDLDTGTEIRGSDERVVHNHLVSRFALYTQGRKGVSVSDDFALRIWNMEQKALEKTINRISSTAPLACVVNASGTHAYVGNKTGELITVSLE